MGWGDRNGVGKFDAMGLKVDVRLPLFGIMKRERIKEAFASVAGGIERTEEKQRALSLRLE